MKFIIVKLSNNSCKYIPLYGGREVRAGMGGSLLGTFGAALAGGGAGASVLKSVDRDSTGAPHLLQKEASFKTVAAQTLHEGIRNLTAKIVNKNQ